MWIGHCKEIRKLTFRALALGRNESIKKMSSDSEPNSFAKSWSSSEEDIIEDDESDVKEVSNTQTDVTRWCHVTFWPRDLNALFEGKIT